MMKSLRLTSDFLTNANIYKEIGKIMAKKNIIIQEEIDRINKIMRNAKMISEGLYMEDDGEGMPATDAYFEEPEEEYSEEPAQEENEDPTKSLGSDFVSKIRAITLDGMKQLNNTPEDPRFQALLKIFNICNKAVDDGQQQGRPEKASNM